MMKKKLLFINKRFTSNNDTMISKTGRAVELSKFMKEFNILFYSLDHKNRESFNGKIGKNINFLIRPFSLAKFFRMISDIENYAISKKADIILATNSPIFGLIGYIVSKRIRKPFIYDLQDNYSSYRPKIPFIGFLDRFLIKRADLVIIVSQSLLRKIKHLNNNMVLIENGIDPKTFYPISRKVARTRIDWNQKDKIILYSGAIAEERGIAFLLEAFSYARKKQNGLKLILIGEKSLKSSFKNLPNVSYLGKVDRNKVNLYLNAADLLVLPNTRNEFTEFCFPLKLVEYISTNKPIVATNVGDVGVVLKKHPEYLSDPDNVEEFALKMLSNINKRKSSIGYISKRYNWKVLARKFEKKVRRLMRDNAKENGYRTNRNHKIRK